MLVTDRFHVTKLALDALQHIIVKLRWTEMNIENNAIAAIKKAKKEFNIAMNNCTDVKNNYRKNILVKLQITRFFDYFNGDTPKQLLVRSRFF